MATSNFKYRGGSRTVESVRTKSQQSGGIYDSFLKPGVTVFKPHDGENNIRIMPASWDDVETWGEFWNLDIHVHYGVGPDNAAYLCLEKMKGERCPVCEARAEAEDDDERDSFRTSRRALAYLIDRDSEKTGPQLWAMPNSVFTEINDRSIDKKHNTPILIDEPEEGYDLSFSKSGKDLRTKYTAMEVMRDPSPLHDDPKLMKRWLTFIQENPLPDMLMFYDAAHIEKVLLGKSRAKRAQEDDDRSDTEREEEARLARRSRRTQDEDEQEERPRRRPSRETSDDEQEERPRRRATSSEDEEEETRPSRRNRSSSEEEEETRPRRSRAPTSDEDAEEETPWDEAKPRRRAPVDEEAEEDKEESPSEQARFSLARMRERRAARG